MPPFPPIERPLICFHCGSVPVAVNASFDTAKLKEFRRKGKIEYEWKCSKCDKVNYFTEKADIELIDTLIRRAKLLTDLKRSATTGTTARKRVRQE